MEPAEIRRILLGCGKPDQEVVLVIETPVKLPKKSPLFGINKVATVKVAVNFNYLERARQVDPSFEFAKKEPGEEEKGTWGAKLMGTPLVEHKGELYLNCWVVESLGYEYYSASGEVLDKAKVHDQLPERRDSMPVRRYKLTNIKSVKLS